MFDKSSKTLRRLKWNSRCTLRTLMIWATTLERKHNKMMLLALFSNLVNKVSGWLLSLWISVWLVARQGIFRLSSCFFRVLAFSVVSCKGNHLYLLQIWSFADAPKTPQWTVTPPQLSVSWTVDAIFTTNFLPINKCFSTKLKKKEYL